MSYTPKPITPQQLRELATELENNCATVEPGDVASRIRLIEEGKWEFATFNKIKRKMDESGGNVAWLQIGPGEHESLDVRVDEQGDLVFRSKRYT